MLMVHSLPLCITHILLSPDTVHTLGLFHNRAVSSCTVVWQLSAAHVLFMSHQSHIISIYSAVMSSPVTKQAKLSNSQLSRILEV